jgi:hypothetical protein
METETEITYDLGKEIAAIISTGATITITPTKTDYGILFLDVQLKLPVGPTFAHSFFGPHPIQLCRCFLNETNRIAKSLHKFRTKFLNH